MIPRASRAEWAPLIMRRSAAHLAASSLVCLRRLTSSPLALPAGRGDWPVSSRARQWPAAGETRRRRSAFARHHHQFEFTFWLADRPESDDAKTNGRHTHTLAGAQTNGPRRSGRPVRGRASIRFRLACSRAGRHISIISLAERAIWRMALTSRGGRAPRGRAAVPPPPQSQPQPQPARHWLAGRRAQTRARKIFNKSSLAAPVGAR
jgi:hypothetical protein